MNHCHHHCQKDFSIPLAIVGTDGTAMTVLYNLPDNDPTNERSVSSPTNQRYNTINVRLFNYIHGEILKSKYMNNKVAFSIGTTVAILHEAMQVTVTKHLSELIYITIKLAYNTRF